MFNKKLKRKISDLEYTRDNLWSENKSIRKKLNKLKSEDKMLLEVCQSLASLLKSLNSAI